MDYRKNKIGPPIKYTKERLKEIAEMIDNYTNASDIPIIAEFAYQNGFYREELYKHEELNYALRRLIDKKEAQLEKLALFNVINSTMASLSLKQLGWRDRQDLNIGGGIQIVYADKDDEKL